MARADRRRRWRRARRKLGGWFLRHFGAQVIGRLSRSWKVEKLDVENWNQACAQRGFLATLWHGRMVVPMTAHANQGLCVLVSPSADGQLVPPLLERLGYQWVLGSSNKNPARAVREMLERLKAGGRIIITPDGPRGPRHSVNPGPAWMARETGFPILPCGCVADRAWRFKSWDRFTLPRWRARVVVVYGAPIFVDPEADDDEIRRATEEMRVRMLAAEEQGFRHLGLEKDW